MYVPKYIHVFLSATVNSVATVGVCSLLASLSNPNEMCLSG